MSSDLAGEVGDYMDELLVALHDEIYDAVQWSAELLQAEAKDRAPVDTYKLQQSINIWDNSDGDVIAFEVGVDDADCLYAKFVEYGTRPHWVPIQPLILWAQRHGMDVGAAYAIQKKIAERGTFPQPFLFMSMEFVAPAVEDRIQQAIDNAIERVG